MAVLFCHGYVSLESCNDYIILVMHCPKFLKLSRDILCTECRCDKVEWRGTAWPFFPQYILDSFVVSKWAPQYTTEQFVVLFRPKTASLIRLGQVCDFLCQLPNYTTDAFVVLCRPLAVLFMLRECLWFCSYSFRYMLRISLWFFTLQNGIKYKSQ